MEFRLREMQSKDLNKTLEWRNDPEVRRTAMSGNPISYKEHEAMFLYNNSLKLVFEVDNTPAGYVQVNRDPDSMSGEWSFHMSKEYKGKGLSHIMLGAALYYLASKEGYEEVTSKVKFDNSISKHLHYKLGFNYTGDKDGIFHYSKKLCQN